MSTYLAAGVSEAEVEKMFYKRMAFDLIQVRPLLDEIQKVMQYEKEKYYLIGRID
jgi:hypothetical protein